MRGGRDDAYEAIVWRYRATLLRRARRFAPPAVAEDAVQQALARAYVALGETDGHVELRPWLLCIVRNAALDLRRSELRDAALEEDPRRQGEPSESVAERRERLRDVVASLQRLPAQQRKALVLRELEGRGHADIAVALGVSEAAARQLIHRARQALRAGLGAFVPWLMERFGHAAGVAGRVADLVGDGAPAGLTKAGAAALAATAIAGSGIVLDERPGVPQRDRLSRADLAPAVVDKRPHAGRPAPGSIRRPTRPARVGPRPRPVLEASHRAGKAGEGRLRGAGERDAQPDAGAHAEEGESPAQGDEVQAEHLGGEGEGQIGPAGSGHEG